MAGNQDRRDRKNLKPISDEQKRQGMLLDYTVASLQPDVGRERKPAYI